jgi:SAM-dependent methyltransferase/tetratricopeptide (TPR) repeat protein
MSRKQRRSARLAGPAPAPASDKAALRGTVAELFAGAVAQHQAGALAEAERRYRHIVSLAPAHAETHSRLGAALMAQGKVAEAIGPIERALALQPDLFEALGNLAQAYLATGRPEQAIHVLSRAFAIKQTPQGKALFAQSVKAMRFTADPGSGIRQLLLRALAEGWARPRELTGACIRLITLSAAANDCIHRATAAWPARLGVAELCGPSGLAILADDPLLCRLLETDPVTDIGLERLLTSVRYAMLTSAAGGAYDESLLGFYCAVARQCFINEYVFSLDAAEAEQAQRLRTGLEAALEAGKRCSPLWPVVAGAYFPLHTVAGAERLLDPSWPQSVQALLAQQIVEPAEERRLAASLPALTAIDGAVSRAVRDQYEENPYPRWAAAGRLEPAAPGERRPQQSVDVLIAGCGTGMSAIDFARQAPQARVLAIDLSLASLSYAKRMAQTVGIANIEFAQADLLKLDSIGRQFDFIDSSGVLHHLADPWQGWRVLLSLLRAGGTMQVGLYSELARRHIVAARALIAERGYRPTPEDIRRCREDIMAAADGSLLKSVAQADDFYATSECRDLLFHVQERRITLPEIKAFLAANDVQFAGFNLEPPVLRRFAARFAEPAAIGDLDRWHVFETEVPDTFAGMYQFWVRKLRADRAAPNSR